MVGEEEDEVVGEEEDEGVVCGCTRWWRGGDEGMHRLANRCCKCVVWMAPVLQVCVVWMAPVT